MPKKVSGKEPLKYTGTTEILTDIPISPQKQEHIWYKRNATFLSQGERWP
jgi:hypothetical protein